MFLLIEILFSFELYIGSMKSGKADVKN